MPNDTIEMLWDCSYCRKRNRGRDMECVGCGKPKKGDEEYLMPDDISSANAVTDPKLLRLAHAGPNWSCKFCNFDSRKPDGSCGQCGAKQEFSTEGRSMNNDRPPEPKPQPKPQARKPRPVRPSEYEMSRYVAPQPVSARFPWEFFGIGGAVLAFALIMFLVLRPKKVDAKVTNGTWANIVHVDRYVSRHHDGWSPPSDAVNVTNLGSRWHHDDKVLDHYDKESYYVSESCGQTCKTVSIPKNCYTTRRTCTSNKNGFASCTGGDTVCTGGGSEQKCSTKYCDVKKWRDVPIYRPVPVYRNYYAWDQWEWVHNRDLRADGLLTQDIRWPSDTEIAKNANVGPGEYERTYNESWYEITFTAKDGSWTYKPTSLSDFQRFKIGDKHLIEVNVAGGVTILQ